MKLPKFFPYNNFYVTAIHKVWWEKQGLFLFPSTFFDSWNWDIYSQAVMKLCYKLFFLMKTLNWAIILSILHCIFPYLQNWTLFRKKSEGHKGNYLDKVTNPFIESDLRRRSQRFWSLLMQVTGPSVSKMFHVH